MRQSSPREEGCGCCRRDFLTAVGASAAVMAFTDLTSAVESDAPSPKASKQGAVVRAVFLYPPSKQFSENPDGWWSWPGNDFDAEKRQQEYTSALRQMERRLGMQIAVVPASVASAEDAQRIAQEIEADPKDGLLLVMFYNVSLGHADQLLKTAEKAGIPAIFFIGLGVKHGGITAYRRPGIYFIQSLDNLDAIEYGLRMINTKKIMGQSKLLSLTEAEAPADGMDTFFGTKIRVIPFSRYADEFAKVAINSEARAFIAKITGNAQEIRQVSQEALENATRAHFALKKILEEEQADGLTMNCLRRGMLKPCISFAALNGELIPAACENDYPAVLTQLLGQQLVGRPGFQHNPCYETERNHYYGSHCTCTTKIYGPDGPELPYLLRRFAHTNEGSCAIQVFWKEDDPVTMVRYYPGQEPALDVYAGRVVKSHAMPPAAGCTTNVEIALTDREDACMVQGHHNLLFCGDFARKFRLFAQLHKMKLAETGFKGPWNS